MPKITVKGTDFDYSLDNGEFPEELMKEVESVLSDMKDNPGQGDNVEIQLVIENDFEPESEDEEESEDESTETPKE